jgi:hypothetical protein
MDLPCKCLYDPLNHEGMSRKERDKTFTVNVVGLRDEV